MNTSTLIGHRFRNQSGFNTTALYKVKREQKQASPWSPSDKLFAELVETQRDAVMRSVLDLHPEQTFCFMDQSKLASRVSLIQQHFLPYHSQRRIAYAVKANPHHEVLKTLSLAGLKAFDCASLNEIKRIRAVDSRAEIFYNHPIKKKKDIREASRMGVKHFTGQTQREVEKILNNIETPQEDNEIALRMLTHNPSAAINLSEKFGALPEVVIEIAEWLRSVAKCKIGISIHTGSQNTDPNQFVQGIEQMMDIAQKIGGISTLNIGGGLPANYHEDDQYDVAEFLDTISSAIIKDLEQVLKQDGKVIIEPGRGIVAESMDLLIPVLSAETRGEKRVIYVDDGIFSSFSDAAIHRWKYPMNPYSTNEHKSWKRPSPAQVFGRTCDSGDSLGTLPMPLNLEEGDYLHIPAAGAYMTSQSTSFNGFQPPEYVLYNPLFS